MIDLDEKLRSMPGYVSFSFSSSSSSLSSSLFSNGYILGLISFWYVLRCCMVQDAVVSLVRVASAFILDGNVCVVTSLAMVAVMSHLKNPCPLLAQDQTQRRDLVNVVDVARAMIHLANWFLTQEHPPKPAIFHVATPKHIGAPLLFVLCEIDILGSGG